MKVCIRCNEKKSLDRFHKRKSSKDGLYSICKDCRKIDSAAYYQNNIDIILKKNHRYYEGNRDKILEQKKAYGQDHKEEISIRMKEYYLDNRDKILEDKKIYYIENIEVKKEYRTLTREQRSISHRLWRISNSDIRNAVTARYRAAKLQAVVSWSNKKYIDMWYEICQMEERRTGRKCNVDHIIPLQSKLVCGLHNEFNLQILFAEDNFSKGNRVWPNMP